MGTRHLTFVYGESDTVMLCMYGQWDGYPSGHGADLAQFLNSFDEIVNGVPLGDKRRLANGMGCLAAQLVAHFKKDVGGFYIHPPELNQDCWQDYEYHIRYNSVKVTDSRGYSLFNGTWKDFAEYCTENAYA